MVIELIVHGCVFSKAGEKILLHKKKNRKNNVAVGRYSLNEVQI